MSLLDEVRAAWPPAEEARPASGYVHPALAEAVPVAATSLAVAATSLAAEAPDHAVVVGRLADGRSLAAPVVPEAGGWRRARPGDGVSEALARALDRRVSLAAGFTPRLIRHTGELLGERALGVEQTNESLVVGSAAVVKWLADPILREPGVPDLQAHLAVLGFGGIPAPIGGLDWTDDSGRTASLAFVTTWIDDASDGWRWCVEDVLAHVLHAPCDTMCEGMRIPARLGQASAALHVALATPSRLIPEPVHQAGAAVIDGWRHSAEAALAEVLATLRGEAAAEVTPFADALSQRIGGFADVASVPAFRIHGDLHVGQVLRSADRLWIIDLDDDISLPPAERGRPLPPARDIAQLLNSFDHVGRMVDDRSAHARPDQVAAWVAAARSSLLGGYRYALAAAGRAELFDERMLVPFEAERVCRELLYAARILPRWMYAPLSTLHRMFDA